VIEPEAPPDGTAGEEASAGDAMTALARALVAALTHTPA
jgi:hypothetical protein